MVGFGRHQDPDPDFMEEEDEEDEDSSFGPIPPPPDHPPPSTDAAAELLLQNYPPEGEKFHDEYPEGEKFGDEYSDEEEEPMLYRKESVDVESQKEDPPAELVHGRSIKPVSADEVAPEDADADADYDIEDDDLEIPPTSVVQRMIMRDNMDKSPVTRSCRMAAIVLCFAVVGIIILASGFGSGLFKNSTPSSAAAGVAGGGSSNTNSTTPSKRNSTTPSTTNETSASVNETRATRVRSYLLSKSMNKTAVGVSNTPQELAIRYLTSNDPLQLDPANAQDKFRLAQKFYLLAGLYYSSKADWTVETGWAATGDECQWYGVFCESKTVDGVAVNVTTEVQLGQNKVDGLSAEVGGLTYLKILDVNSNSMVGVLPDSIGNMSSLQELYVETNNITGFPSSLSGLKNLTVLFANDNQLSDDVSKFFQVPSLIRLMIHNNKLSGSLDGVSKLKSIQWLALGNNKLGGTIGTEFGSLSSLNVLWLYKNNLKGSIPSVFGGLQNLQVFDASTNSLGDSSGLPQTFKSSSSLIALILSNNNFGGNLTDQFLSFSGPLQQLQIENCSLAGTISSNLGNLKSLSVLRLSYNNFNSGQLPTSLLRMSQLQDFRCSGCNVVGSLPDFSNLVNLKILLLDNNGMSGSLPSSLASLVRLEQLNLGKQYFSGGVPSQWGNWVNMTKYNLAYNGLTGSLPDVSKMSKLEVLELEGNQLTGDISGLLRPSLKYLDLSEMKFYGSLPSDWSSMVNLEELHLSTNQFYGSIPSSMSSLSKLQILGLQSNQLQGTIPDILSSWQDLADLELGNNNLRGQIPSSIGSLKKLKIVRVNNNYIGGSLPQEINNLNNVVIFDCQQNNITGTLPDISSMKNLAFLDISSNSFEGTLPTSIASLKKLQEIVLYGNKFTSGSWPKGICSISTLTVAYPDCSLGCSSSCCQSCK